MAENGNHYVFASQRQWYVYAFFSLRKQLPGTWTVITDKRDLSKTVEDMRPRYVFFAHWSNIVPEEILAATECVCFHMTDVPYGRGGSPLQNLISAGHSSTVLTALRMVTELDAGPVYDKRELSLDGAAHEIFDRAALVIMDMISEISQNEPVPVRQEGPVVEFSRRTPEQSRIPQSLALDGLYDHIRMLDAAGYPSAFIDYGDWNIEFSNARMADAQLECLARFKKRRENSD